MHTQRHIATVALLLAVLSVGAAVTANESPRTTASVTSDCVGKPYGTAGCPVSSSSASEGAIPAMCGNGVVDPGEQCDNGHFNGVSNCTKYCTLLYCGDNLVSPQIGEECEPQTQLVYAIDPSTGQLTTEVHYLQQSCGTICTVPTCDASGNCSGGCRHKFLPACPVNQNATSLSQAVSSSSSSVAAAPLQMGAASSSAFSIHIIAVPRCGDGVIQTGEQCDDGPNNSNAPNASCRVNCMLPSCGDGTLDVARGELCDDGPNNSNAPNAHCRMDCTLPKCGDGVIDTSRGEQCDDGPNNSNASGAHCRLDCTLPKCGDGVTDPGEQCDDGPANSDAPNAHCNTQCKLPTCGDGIVQGAEQCDDGPNNSNGPNAHCRVDCTLPKCGDGITDTLRGEQCDDGPNNSNAPGARCRLDCTLSKCGDGVIDPSEQCDDGIRNGTNGDACSAQCMLAKQAAAVSDTATSSVDSSGASVHASASSSPALPFEAALAAFGGLSVAAYLLRKRLHDIISKVAGEQFARSIDDIPLDQIEMPWHKW